MKLSKAELREELIRRMINDFYKDMGLKDKLPNMPEEEQLGLLATNGMLVKRNYDRRIFVTYPKMIYD